MFLEKYKPHNVKQMKDLRYPDIFSIPIDNIWTLEYLNVSVSNEEHKIIVACDNDEIIGLAKAEISTSSEFPLFVKRQWFCRE